MKCQLNNLVNNLVNKIQTPCPEIRLWGGCSRYGFWHSFSIASLPGGLMIRNTKGQGLTEYIILLLLISVACITIVRSIGVTVHTKLEVARDHINKDISIGDSN